MQNSLPNHIANAMRQDATYKLISSLFDTISGTACRISKIGSRLTLRKNKQQYTNITEPCQFH